MDMNALTHEIIGAAIEVHQQLGPGLLEEAYQSAMECELQLRQIPYERQKPLPVVYKGKYLMDYRLALLVGGLVVVELKAVDHLAAIHDAQLLNYLKLTKCPVGLLMNFNVTQMIKGIRRLVNGPAPQYLRTRK